jgi:hypothetical protein
LSHWLVGWLVLLALIKVTHHHLVSEPSS